MTGLWVRQVEVSSTYMPLLPTGVTNTFSYISQLSSQDDDLVEGPSGGRHIFLAEGLVDLVKEDLSIHKIDNFREGAQDRRVGQIPSENIL